MSLAYPCVYCTDGKKCTKFSDAEITSWCVLGPCEYETPSNADRIRAMTDEELARRIAARTVCMECILLEQCNRLTGRRRCVDMWLDWLKSPAEVDNG